MERSRQNTGRCNTAHLLRMIEESQRVTESGHGRSLASRLGMPEMSCFPSSRSRRVSSRTELLDDVPRTGSQRRSYDSPFRSDTSRMGSVPSRIGSQERGKSQVFPRDGSSGMLVRNNELAGNFQGKAVEDTDPIMNLEDKMAASSYFDLSDSEAASDSEDHVFDLASLEGISERDRLEAYKSPSFLSADSSLRSSACKRKSCASARGSTSTTTSSRFQDKSKLEDHLTGLNTRRSCAGMASSSRSPPLLSNSVVEGHRPQKTRLSRKNVDTSDSRDSLSLHISSCEGDARLSEYDGLLNLQMEQQAQPERLTNPLFSRGSSSFMSASDVRAGGRSRVDGFASSLRDKNGTSSPMPLPRSSARNLSSSRLHGANNDNGIITGGEGSSSHRFGRVGNSRSMASGSSLPSSRVHAHGTESDPHGSGGSHLFTRRNITNCFPALGGATARRSSSPLLGQTRQVGGHRSPRRATTGSQASAGIPPSQLASSSSSSSSSQGPVSLLAAALEMMPSSSSFQSSSGREQLASAAESVLGLASQELNWASSSGWEYHRPRLMAEGLAKILMALERVESDDELTHEQLLMLEATVLFGGMAVHDEHRDLRLDVDNMSYEELLALGDHIGSVNTGLSEDFIVSRLRKSKFCALDASLTCQAKDGELKCSICQEEYEDGDEVGRINCGHRYHANCIRQWLVQKNLCPICKASAL